MLVRVAVLFLVASMINAFLSQKTLIRPRVAALRMCSSTSDYLSHTATKLLTDRIRSGLCVAFGQSVGDSADTLLFPAKPEHGDYQCNAALPLAKKLKLKPQEIANKLMESLDVGDLVEEMNISGPGFINIKLSDTYLKSKITNMLTDSSGRLGIPVTKNKQRIIVDFSSPNIAKEMHVGHLRSTIIGDSLSRLLEFNGHDVLRLNHVGDWGTQFGMLITYLNSQGEGSRNISDLVQFYKAAKKRFDEDIEFQDTARNEVVKLQSGDKDSLKAWQDICDVSRVEFNKIYEMLDIENLQERGESFYNPLLLEIVKELESSGLGEESQGALCVFLPGYKNPDGTPQPLIVRKSDGGFLYATTDMAAVKQRVNTEKADRILYVTDVGQSQHFEMIFKAADSAGFLEKEKDGSRVELKHVPFGLVQGEDGKKFKTRSGDTVKLKDLLEEAISKATEDMASRSEAGLTEEQKYAARVVGIGAVKYADLSMNRESNYRFSFKKMLALSGNTAPYMLYAFARIKGIKRKALLELGGESEKVVGSMSSKDIIIETKEEKALIKQLLRLEETLLDVERDLYPNKLCEYLFELSQKFNQFYENCPVLKAETPELVKSRTALCSLTADALQVSLGLLGIKTIDKL